ncbi:hypothetical protein ACFQ3J_17685 [Paenibacillus provencensis]|uniref:Uncharacterized protein n=1 Tax=Paenibacillus provencensis TaxID=441151 RepID=A0ABW3PXQ1_9BACL|nr:hypothetical protein [Paenibacillus sp. MER 78]MCM3128409.1 hypothetical protein [Paenibacillus sp. MER 78]
MEKQIMYEAAFDAYQVSSGSIACEYTLWKGRSFQSTELNIPRLEAGMKQQGYTWAASCLGCALL